MQTAVEWLVKTIGNAYKEGIFEQHFCKDIEQAKQMDKEQQFRFFIAGQLSMEEGGRDFEQYYKETYDRTTDTEQAH